MFRPKQADTSYQLYIGEYWMINEMFNALLYMYTLFQ